MGNEHSKPSDRKRGHNFNKKVPGKYDKSSGGNVQKSFEPSAEASSVPPLRDLSLLSKIEIDFNSNHCTTDPRSVYNLMVNKSSAYLDDWMKEFQKSSKIRMQKDIKENNLEMFILNNLLMCYQFFDNFDLTFEKANAWKYRREKKMNHQLLTLECDENKILAEYRAFILHGIPHYLNKNYIYARTSEDICEAPDLRAIGGEEIKKTHMPNGLLPLDFCIFSGNLEIYKENQWKDLIQEENEYSNPAGEKSVLKFCIEEPNEKNKVLKGYARLRAVDTPELIYDTSKWLVHGQQGSDDGYEVIGSNSKLSAEEFGDPESDYDTAINTNESGVQFLDEIRQKMGSKAFGSTLSIAPSKSGSLSSLVSLSLQPITIRTELEGKPMTLSDKILSKISPELLKKPKEKAGDGQMRKSKSVQNFDTSSSGFSGSLSDLTKAMKLKGNNNLKPYGGIGTSIISRSVSVSEISILAVSFPMSDDEDSCWPSEESVLNSSQDSIEIDSRGKAVKKKKDGSQTLQAEKKLKTYLNAAEVAHDFYCNFHKFGKFIDLPSSSLGSAVVQGATVSIPIYEDFSMIHNFTPFLTCDFWPKKVLSDWNHNLVSKKGNATRELRWPNDLDSRDILNFGCALKPLSFRPIVFDETDQNQTIDWQLNFPRAEHILLNTFRNVHWRAYIYSALIYRAFIAPLGPQGIDLSHFRNIIYFMCHSEFAGWNDEEPGLHLKAILSKVYNCLGQRKMPNFFVRSRNLLKFISKDKVSLVQGHLSRIKENLVIYSIFALKGLKCTRPSNEAYPAPNLDELIQILTVVGETPLIHIMYPHIERVSNPHLPKFTVNNARNSSDDSVPFVKNAQQRPRKISAALSPHHTDSDSDIFGRPKTAKTEEKVDEVQDFMRRKHKKHMENKKKKDQLKRRGSTHGTAGKDNVDDTNETMSISSTSTEQSQTKIKQKQILEKQRAEINLFLEKQITPQRDFSNLRLVLVLEYFIKHFLEMGAKSKTYKDYCSTMMYALHIENLCDIMDNLPKDKTPSCTTQIKIYRENALSLRTSVGKEKHQYIYSKIAHLVTRPVNINEFKP